MLASAIGTAGGITSLISYPVFLAIGLSPIRANMANTVALVGNWPGSTYAAQRELAGRARRMLRLVPFAVAGSALGTGLLLTTPAGVFDRIVPFFLLAASVALLFQPRLASWRRDRLVRGGRPLMVAALFAVCCYDGYFGAGSGVMLLALLLVALDDSLPVANAHKNFLIGVSDAVSALGFCLFGTIAWAPTVALGVGAVLGGLAGPRVARRVAPRTLRLIVAFVGLGLAVKLFVAPT